MANCNELRSQRQDQSPPFKQPRKLKLPSDYKRILFILIAIFIICSNGTAFSQQLAFPTAEGFGKYTSGGRGGQVIAVTNLNDYGPGSLRAAIKTKGTRTVVFRISGTIALKSELIIKNSDLTIAGQTAPGDGICLRNYPLIIDADNVIIRFIRARLGDECAVEGDAISVIFQKNIMLDHCSFSWGTDEVASIRDNINSTMQWCLISESLNHSVHHKGDHGYGGIWGGMGATFHHNLIAHNASRNPRFNGSRYNKKPQAEIVDFRNNVIYNWGFNSVYGGEGGHQNIIANYYKSGPASECKDRIVDPWDSTGQWYVADNFVYGFPSATADNWADGVQGKFRKYGRVDTPFQAVPVVTHPAEIAYELVLAECGAIFPKRDPVDARIIQEVRSGTATYGGITGATNGIIDSQKSVGGWPTLYSSPAKKDADQDGMADDWELAHNLNPADPRDRNDDFNGDGYTNLEKYLNSLIVRSENAGSNRP
ncbi:MAG: pectate lyase [Candidatus Neomarinimicrobiota bacterium]